MCPSGAGRVWLCFSVHMGAHTHTHREGYCVFVCEEVEEEEALVDLPLHLRQLELLCKGTWIIEAFASMSRRLTHTCRSAAAALLPSLCLSLTVYLSNWVLLLPPSALTHE